MARWEGSSGPTTSWFASGYRPLASAVHGADRIAAPSSQPRDFIDDSIVEVNPPVLHGLAIGCRGLVIHPGPALEPIHVPRASGGSVSVLALPRVELGGVVRRLLVRAAGPVMKPIVLAGREHRHGAGLVILLARVG